MGECGFQREPVALAAQAGNDARRNVGKIRMPTEPFSCMYVGQMDFNEGNGDGSQGIAQGHAGVRVAAGIDDDEADPLLAGGLNTVDQFAFVIALKAFQPYAAGAGPRFHRGMNVSQRGTSINLWLARAKEVQIRPVEYQNSGIMICVASGFVVCLLRHDRKFAANGSSLSSLLR